jgi:hypothetical protein
MFTIVYNNSHLKTIIVPMAHKTEQTRGQTGVKNSMSSSGSLTGTARDLREQ